MPIYRHELMKTIGFLQRAMDQADEASDVMYRMAKDTELRDKVEDAIDLLNYVREQLERMARR